MIPQLGPLEILVVIIVALLVFGPKRLPEVARQVGRGIREVKKVQEQLSAELHGVLHADEEPVATTFDPGATLAVPIRRSEAEPEPSTPGTGDAPAPPQRGPEPGRAPSRFRPPAGS
ncbi:MAG: twin-arginine translocase TatA/TatE family subunit [Actinomycetes bacterium]